MNIFLISRGPKHIFLPILSSKTCLLPLPTSNSSCSFFPIAISNEVLSPRTHIAHFCTSNNTKNDEEARSEVTEVKNEVGDVQNEVGDVQNEVLNEVGDDQNEVLNEVTDDQNEIIEILKEVTNVQKEELSKESSNNLTKKGKLVKKHKRTKEEINAEYDKIQANTEYDDTSEANSYRDWLEKAVIFDCEKKKATTVDFWFKYYKLLNQIASKAPSNRDKYKNEVFTLLEEFKATNTQPYNNNKLHKLQSEIEKLTMVFDEKRELGNTDISKRLIDDEKKPAKDYLLDKLKVQGNSHNYAFLNYLGQYTLEALIIYVIGQLFHTEDSHVRAATMVDQLETNVMIHIRLILIDIKKKEEKKRKKKEETSEIDESQIDEEIESQIDEEIEFQVDEEMKEIKKNIHTFEIGRYLLEFMCEERRITSLVIETKEKGEKEISRKKKAFFVQNPNFVICNLDLGKIPIRYTLPMVCKPDSWKCAHHSVERAKFVTDLKGGYLSHKMSRYRLLSSNDINHYYINIEEKSDEICTIMNKLQNQPFKINKGHLEYIEKNHHDFVKWNFLMPKCLRVVDREEMIIQLRACYFKNENIRSVYKLENLIQILLKDIQKAQYETMLFALASAFDGFKLYLPAFLDFRGRIYRSGLLHYHERDLVRSLLLFDMTDHKYDQIPYDINIRFMSSIAFYYKKHESIFKSLEWFHENDDLIRSPASKLIKNLSKQEVKKPFQFLASCQAYVLNDETLIKELPITQDASASAFQIMSFFLLDYQMAQLTNLIPNEENIILDIYTYIKEILLNTIENTSLLNEDDKKIIRIQLTRSITKSIFMPIIYGKTMHSTINDLKKKFGNYLSYESCKTLGKMCFQLWGERYSSMNCLITLVKTLSWIISAKNCQVVYKTPFFSTVQDYMIYDTVNVLVYGKKEDDGQNEDDSKPKMKKKTKITLRVPSDKRDKKKTYISSFVNLIHQKDAFIAMSLIDRTIKDNMPIYTVHDNFISTIVSSHYLPIIYGDIFINMNPLKIINEFLLYNLVKIDNGGWFDHGEERMHIDKIINSIIEDKMLREILESYQPQLKLKKDKDLWNSKMDTIVSLYKNYINILCATTDRNQHCTSLLDKYESNLTHFRKGILREPSFCIHY